MKNMLVNLSIKDFLAKTASNEPVPGGGSISALNAGLAAALTQMVTNLTIGRKKYEAYDQEMQEIALATEKYREKFIKDIDADSDAYNQVFAAFKMPKETEEEQKKRSQKIQDTTIHAAEVPLSIAQDAYEMMVYIEKVVEHGNQNAITDACVAMMAARTAVLGAALNVKINLGSIKDEAIVKRLENAVAKLEKGAVEKEQKVLEKIKQKL